MSEDKVNVPKIRFPGFNDDWEQRKLGDFVEEYVEKTTIQNQYPVLTSSQQRGIVLQEEYFANRQVTTNDNVGYFVLPKGYFTYRSRSDNSVFVFNRNDLIEKGMISYFYPVFNVINSDSEFFLRRINNGIERQVATAAEGTGQHVLSLKKFKNIVSLFPSIEEQQQIGTFFKKLDNLITLHQRKLNNVKNMKAGLLQKMFPKDGKDSPEVRFPGFTDAWEQRELGELADFTKGTGYTKGDLRETGSPIILYGRLYTDYETLIEDVNTFVNLKENSVISLGGEVVVPSSGESAEDIARASVVGKPGIILGGDLNIIKPVEKIDPVFLALAISNGTPNRDMVKRAQGKSVVHLHNSDLKKINLIFPQIEEQRNIVNLYLHFDNLITLHQRKLQHLQEQKKAFLQQMFV